MKFLNLLFVLAFVFSLASCGSQPAAEAPKEEAPKVEEAPKQEEAPKTEEAPKEGEKKEEKKAEGQH
jgi:hypothetical protein